jgi:hypothetical protein
VSLARLPRRPTCELKLSRSGLVSASSGSSSSLLDFPARVAMREVTIEAVIATKITSSETAIGTCRPKPCTRSFAPTNVRIAASP